MYLEFVTSSLLGFLFKLGLTELFLLFDEFPECKVGVVKYLKTLVALMPFANCADLSFETLTSILHFYVSQFLRIKAMFRLHRRSHLSEEIEIIGSSLCLPRFPELKPLSS